MSDRPEFGARLKARADQPIEQSHKGIAIALMVLLVVTAIVLSVVKFPTPKDPAPARTPPPAAAPAPTPAVAPEPTSTTAVGTPEDVTAGTLKDAKHAARRFLAGYLPYTYGQQPIRRIKGASPALIQMLKANPPRVPPASDANRRRPTIDALTTAENATGTTVTFAALVSDGAQDPYSVTVTVELVDGKWLATSV